MKLKGKTGLVTGAGRGIGRAIALALARAGAEVAVLDIVRESAEAVRREVEALGDRTPTILILCGAALALFFAGWLFLSAISPAISS